MVTPEKSARRRRAKGSVIEKNGAWFWRRRQSERDLPLVHLGRVSDLSERAAIEKRDRLLMEHNPIGTGQGTSLTVRATAALYERLRISVVMKPSGARSVRSRLYKHIVPNLGDLELRQVDALATQEFIAVLAAQRLSRRTIDAVLATLSCLLDFARQSGYPAPRLDRKMIRLPPHALDGEQRWFTPDEVHRILMASPWPWRACFAIAATLGLRCGEVLGLRWSDVDFKHSLIRIRQNAVTGQIGTVKSKNSRADLPMPAPLQRELQTYEAWFDAALAEQHSDKTPASLLFSTDEGLPYTGNDARRELSRVLVSLGIPQGGMHAFRHGVVTRLLNAGVPIHVVRAIVRHGRIETTQRYSHAEADSLRDAIGQGNKWGTAPADSPSN